MVLERNPGGSSRDDCMREREQLVRRGVLQSPQREGKSV